MLNLSLARKSLARRLVLVAIAAQVLVLAWMAGKREYIQATGEKVYLRSAPIDPRDPFRGDFVRLRYDINSLPKQHYKGAKAPEELTEGDLLYAVLKRGPRNIVTLEHLTDERPGQDLFIRGRLTRDWRFAPMRGDGYINIKYGIEQYFVQQGKGREMEVKLGERDTLQIPVEMQIALGSDGTAVIIGHRWSKLGIQLEFIRAAQARVSPDDPVVSPVIKITLQNVSDDPLALPMPKEDCAFSLVRQSGGRYEEQADRGCNPASAEQVNSIVLNPAESYSVELDLSQPRWHILHEGSRKEIGAVTDRQQFRVAINLRSSGKAPDNYKGVPFWFGELHTPLFTTSGRID